MMRATATGDFLTPDTDAPDVANVYVHITKGDEYADDDPLVAKYGYAFEPAEES